MTGWMIWFAMACALAILEMATGTFYLLVIAIGAAAGGIAALAGMGGAWQCIVAAAVAAIGTYALRRSKFGRPGKIAAARDPDVNLDIGQTLEVTEWRSTAGVSNTARVMYRGALWDIDLAEGGSAIPGIFVIQEVRGNRLIVINSGSVGRAQ